MPGTSEVQSNLNVIDYIWFWKVEMERYIIDIGVYTRGDPCYGGIVVQTGMVWSVPESEFTNIYIKHNTTRPCQSNLLSI